MIDLIKVRRDTPNCTDKLFFNSAGSSLPPTAVTEAMKSYLDQEAKYGGYFVAEKMSDEIKEFYNECADLLNARPENIAFTYNATDSYARALSSISFEKGDVILTTDDDYISNQIAFLSLKSRFGIEIVRGNLDNGSDLDLEDFEKSIRTYHPKLVAVTHVPTNSGKVQNIEAIGKLCEMHEILYLVDACQSAGQIPLDVRKIKCDFLSATGRKFLRGPRGTGILFVSDNILNQNLTPLMIDMRGADWVEENKYKLFSGARRFEMWEFSYSHLVGLAAAINYANTVGVEHIVHYNQMVCSHLRKSLLQLDRVHLYDHGSRLGSIITFRKDGVSLRLMKAHLAANNVFFSVATINNARIDFAKKGIVWAVRLSPHYFNTIEEVNQLVDVIDRM